MKKRAPSGALFARKKRRFSDVAKPSLVSELPIKREFMNIFYAHGAIEPHPAQRVRAK